MGGLAGAACAGPEQPVDGAAEGEADRGPPALQSGQPGQRHRPDGAGTGPGSEPEHLARLPAVCHTPFPGRPGGLDHRLGRHCGGR